MNFIGSYQFGSLTTKNGQVIKFEDIDKDGDGKISQQEYLFIQKELGVDTLELSDGGKKGEKQVTDREYVMWAIEIQTDNILNEFISQVAVDFIGSNSVHSPRVIAELRKFTAEFKANFDISSDDVSALSDDFTVALQTKYDDLKADLLGTEKDYEKIQQEWEKQVDEFNKNIKNASSIPEFVKLNREFLKAHGEYLQKMLVCNDLDAEFRKSLIEEAKTDVEKAKRFANLMSDGINMQGATEVFLNNLKQQCPDWNELESNPIVANPDLYMFEFSQSFKPSILEPSLTEAYRKHLNSEFQKLLTEYEHLPQNRDK